ncbi:hypothetical protein [Kitasatospora viridis]|uniref:Transcriptional regulator n=1 Tax=Kitasatospora viridis TaxID=281105 RepID=A0A561TVB6_9ACTN|nr:hypothetical protein [Kitasatospora viridis]TWF91049.1 hypothetical protein FHX73_12161 [Kitasatospora viridis]
MVSHRVPNVQLRALLAEAQWTGEQLAGAVNRIGAESGWRLAYRRASVHQWLTGTLPRSPAADLVCVALSRRLRRPIALTDAGFDGPRPALPPATDSGTLLVRLAEASVAPDRHGSLLAYQPAALVPGPAEPVAPTGLVGAGGPAVRQDVLALLLPVFSSVDRAHGGGRARTALAAFLATTVAPMLAVPAHPSAVLRDAARLCYLCAFMHLDDELNGLADQYYRRALELARQAGDTATQAMALRAMAAQAYELGRPDRSLRLARAAADCRLASSPRLRAAVLGQLALSEATAGERTAALRHLSEARELLTRVTGPPPAIGDYHRASWDHQSALVQAELGDLTGAITHLKASVARRPRGEQRSRAILLGKLAERQLTAGHLEAACTTWHEFLDAYPLLTSRRAHTARTRLSRLLLPHRRRPAADHLLQRAAALRPR